MMCDGFAYILSVFYGCGDGKTMFSPILEVTTIQDDGALEERVYTRTQLCYVTARWWRVGRTSGLGLWAEVPMPDVYSCVVLKGT